jgi:integrase
MNEQWQQCRADFIQHIYARSQSSESRRVYTLMLTMFFTQDKAPDRYTRADVEAFLHKPTDSYQSRGKPPSVATMNLRLVVLRSFYAYAATYLILGPDGSLHPLLQVPAPTIGVRRGKPRRVYPSLSYEEMERLFSVIPTDTVVGLRDRALFLMYFWTARRRSEIARLRWKDIEPTTFVDSHGRPRPGWLYRFYGKGDGQQQDSAELPTPAKEALDHYLIASGRMETITPDDPIFVALKPPYGGGFPAQGTQPLNGGCIAKILKDYAQAAGIDPAKVTVHTWRHTAARARYAAGEDIRSLQRLLRHKSLGTTDVYLAVISGTADPGASLLEERFAGFSSQS